MVTHMQPDKQARKLSPERVYIYFFLQKLEKFLSDFFLKKQRTTFVFSSLQAVTPKASRHPLNISLSSKYCSIHYRFMYTLNFNVLSHTCVGQCCTKLYVLLILNEHRKFFYFVNWMWSLQCQIMHIHYTIQLIY